MSAGYLCLAVFCFSSRRRHTRCALVTGVQTCALPICLWDRLPLPEARALYEQGVGAAVGSGRTATLAIHNSSLQRQLALLFAVALLLGIEGLWKGGNASGRRETLPASPVAVLAWQSGRAAWRAVVGQYVKIVGGAGS